MSGIDDFLSSTEPTEQPNRKPGIDGFIDSTGVETDGIWDVAKKSFLHGVGRIFSDDDKALVMAAKPSYKTDEEWLATVPEWRKAMWGKGEELKNENNVQTTPWTTDWAVQGVAGMAPEVVSLAVASAGLMRGASPSAAAAKLGTEGSILQQTGRAGVASMAGDLAAGAVIAPAQAVPESSLEANSAYEDAIKAGYTPEQAAAQRDYVMHGNVGVLSASDAVQNALAFNKFKVPGGFTGKLLSGLGKLGTGMTAEGVEEGTQEALPAWAQNKEANTDRVLEAAALGALGGGVFHAAGRGISAFLDRTKKNGNEPSADTNNPPSVDMPDNIQAIIDGANRNQPGGGTTLAVADGVEDSDLSHTNASIVQRAEALNKFAIDNFGQPLTVTGGWRSPENNARSNGAENSRHLSGGALDISTEGLNDEQRQLLFKMAGELGFDTNEDVIYHDRGSGYHMHLQDAGSQQNAQQGRMSKEAFFNAVAGQESGGDYAAENGRTGAFGKYQIMPDNWPSWSQEAGLEEGAPMTPENQEKVARYKLGDYYDKYGPEGALVAWYSGEGNAQRWAEGKSTAMGENGEYSWDAKQGKGDEPSIREYVQQSLGRAGAQPGRTESGSSIADSILNSPPMFSTNGGIIDFASDKFNTSDDAKEINFFGKMFDSNDKFIDTPENRKAIEDKYGDELKAYLAEQETKQDQKNLQELATQEQQQPVQEQQPAPAAEPKVSTIQPIKGKWQEAVKSQKLQALADKAVAGDALAIKGLSNAPLEVRNQLILDAQKRAETTKGEPIHENTTTSQRENTADQIQNPEHQQSQTAATQENVTKEPWEMTKEEYHNKRVSSIIRDYENGSTERNQAQQRTVNEAPLTPDEVEALKASTGSSDLYHRQYVEQAAEEGKPVPENVLAEYPGLQVQKKEIPSNMEEALASLPDAQLNKIAKLLKVRKAGSKSRNGFIERIVDSHGKSEISAAYEKIIGEKNTPSETPVNIPTSDVKNDTTEKTQEAETLHGDNVARQEEEHNGSDTNAPLDATSKKEDNVIKEAADLYAAATEKFPEIVADRKVKHRVENAIQQTLDFGQIEGDVLQQETHLSLFGDDGKLAGDVSGRETAKVQTKEKRAAQQVALGVTRELVNEGAVSLVGKQVHSIQELAEIAQVLRHPGYEKFHRVYADENDNIVYHETVSCMLPSEASVYAPEDNGDTINLLMRMDADIARLGAKKVYLIHNHPSTNPEPSKEDIHLTKTLANVKFSSGKPGPVNVAFAGHIVLDTDTYAKIDRDGRVLYGHIDEKYRINMTDAETPHVTLGEHAYSPSGLAAAAKQLADGCRTTAFFMTTKGHIRGVVHLPDAVAKMGPSRISRYLRWLARANYSNYCSIATSDPEAFNAYKELVDKEHLADVLLTTEGRTVRRTQPTHDTWFGIPSGKGGKRLLETGTRYDITGTPAFKRWFGDSKVVDEQGKPLVVYHGTGTEITAFDPSLTGKGRDQLGSGFYFTTQKEEADDYSSRRIDAKTEKLGGEDNPNVLNVYLAIKKPLVVNGSSLADVDFELSTRQAAAIIGRAPKIMDKEESPLGDYVDTYWTTGPNKSMITKVAKEYEGVPLYNIENDFFRDDAGAFRQAVYEVLGYDGVVKDFGDGRKHYVAWFPEQIKSVNNSGAFDPNNDNIYFSADKDTLQQRYRKLMDEGISRSHALDVLVDDYEPAHYERDNGVPGFAQHEEITPGYLEQMRTILSQFVGAGKAKDVIVIQLYQRYNEFKGNRKHSTDLAKTVDKMAFLKGVMWHVSKENDIFGTEPDTGRAGAGKLLRTPWDRFLNGVPGSSRERRLRERATRKTSITKNRSENQGDFSLPEDAKRSQDAFSDEDLKELLAYRGQDVTFVPDGKINSSERAITSMGETMGVKVRFFIGDPSLRGFHFGDVTYINRKGNRGPAWTFWHEHMHWLRNNDEALYQDVLQAVEDASHVTDKQVETYRDTIAFGDKMERSAVVEEMLADELADSVSRRGLLESIAMQDKSLFYRLGEFFQKVIAKLKAAVSGQEEQRDSHLNLAQVKALEQQVRQAFGLAAVDGKRLYTDRSKFPYKEVPAYSSEEQVSDSFEKQLDDWAAGNRNRRLPLQIGETPKVLQDVGAKALPLEISPSVVHKIVAPATEKGGKHGLTLDMLKQIPDQLADPVMVLKSATRPEDSLVVLTELHDGKGNSIITSISLDVQHGKNLVNAISSVYGKDNSARFVQRQINAGNLLYKNKEKSLVWAQATGLQLPGAVPTRDSSSTSNIQQKEEEVNSEDANIRYSMVGKATDKLAEKVGIKKAPNPNIKIGEKAADDKGSLNILDWMFTSPSRIAKKVPGFTQFFRYADNAMRKLTKLRYEWNKELIDAFELVSKKSERDQLFEVLWRGDMEGKEWTKQELLEQEKVPESVANAYERIRKMMDAVYEQLNAARRQTQTHSKNITDAALEKLKANKFVEVVKVTPGEEGQQLVTWKEAANWKKDYTVTEDALKLMRENEAIQILSEKPAGKDEEGNPVFAVQVRESIPNLNRLTGYIPHFFHDFHVRVKIKDEKAKDGFRYETFDSGRNIKEATKKAEAYLKEHPGAEIVIQPQTFDFTNVGLSKEEQAKFAAVIGDKDFYRLAKQTAKDNEISFKEAKEMIQETVKTKNRHRFNGNFFQRKGVKGYEQEMQWVLSHYINTSSRYVAMETEFKPKAIGLFERMYGDFSKDQKGLAHYVKDYINDINGNPSNLETIINDWVNNTAFARRVLIPTMGERSALQITNTASGAVAVAKLGVFNVSSALLNFSQLVNSAGLIGDVSAFYKCLHKGSIGGESALEKRVLQESGVLYDIGFESASGYGNHSIGKWADKSMFFFKKTEAICRRGTVLAAYHKGIAKGMSHDAAVEYAREINHKANFEYGVQDAPNVFRRGSVISQLLLQFKKYPIKEFELMGEMLGSETSVKQKVIFWGGYLLLSGLLQIPAIDWFDNIIEAATGLSPKTKAKKLMFEFAGRNPEYKPLINLAVYGLGSVANVDFSSRAGVGDAIPKSLSEMTGPFFNTLWSVPSNLAKGQFITALQSLSPGMANIVMAAQGEKRGSRDRVTTTYDTAYEKVLRAAGFKSVKESTDTDIQNIKRKEDEELQKDKQKAIDAYLKNPTTENAQKLQSLRVTPAAVRNERRRKEEDKGERTRDTMSRKDRQRYIELLDFADD